MWKTPLPSNRKNITEISETCQQSGPSHQVNCGKQQTGYLHWDNHHHLVAKYSVISTLIHRARTVCTKTKLFSQELQHLREALIKCKYPKWALGKTGRRFIRNNHDGSSEENNQYEQSGGDNDINNGDPEGRDTNKDRYTKRHIVILYMQGLGKSIKNIYKSYGIQDHFKENRSIKNILVNPKDKDPVDRKSGAIYWY